MENLSSNEQQFFLRSSSNRPFGVRSFLAPSDSAKGILLIIPGMSEHSGRYRRLAAFLTENQYNVFALDHPGQGLTAGSVARLGRIPGTRGWEIMLENIRALYTHIRKNRPDLPVYIFGHSMGSILARHFTAVYPVYIQGLIISGSFDMLPGLAKLIRMLIRIKVRVSGSRQKSRWLNRLFFWNFNRHFNPKLTAFEWISSVRDEVDAYVNDPYCGFSCSNGFYDNLFKGVAAMKKSNRKLKYRKTLPVLILSGQDDPVGNFGKDAIKIHHEFYRQKFQNLNVKVFRGRHELLNDQTREKVQEYLLNWLNDSLKIK